MRWPIPLGVLAAALVLSTTARAIPLVKEPDFTLDLGFRIQPRFELERESGPGGDSWRRDFMVRRTRIVATGEMQRVSYKFEWKVDGADRLGQNPSAQVENIFLIYPVCTGVSVKAGLYDAPYSRDRLTPDSQQIVVDRGAVSNVPDALGLVDNAVGIELLGKVAGGRAEYAAGLFDNRTLPTRFQDMPMAAGRLDLHLGATHDVLSDAHFGDETWCSIGIDGSYQGALEDSSGGDHGLYRAAGLDAMIDCPMSLGRVLVRGEFNGIDARAPGGADIVHTAVWMVGLGVLVGHERLQPTVRFDQTRRDPAQGGGTLNTTYAGLNFYQRRHQMKLQADVRFDAGNGEAVDGGRLQAQFFF